MVTMVNFMLCALTIIKQNNKKTDKSPKRKEEVKALIPFDGIEDGFLLLFP